MDITYSTIISNKYELSFPVEGQEALAISRCVSFLIGITSASFKHPTRLGIRGMVMYKKCENDRARYILEVHTNEDLSALLDNFQDVIDDINNKIGGAWG